MSRTPDESGLLTVHRNLGLVDDLAFLESQGWKPRLAKMLKDGEAMAADGLFYHDSRGPFVAAAQTAILLGTTDKLIFPGSLTALPANYFTMLGKKLRLNIYGTITTAVTPGNIGVELYYGTTDAGGTLLASSAAIALVASQATIPFSITALLQCRGVGAIGAGGSLFAYASLVKFGTAVIASPNDDFLIPASAPAAVNSDTTIASGFNIQFKRSGSTAESVTVHDLTFESLN